MVWAAPYSYRGYSARKVLPKLRFECRFCQELVDNLYSGVLETLLTEAGSIQHKSHQIH